MPLTIDCISDTHNHHAGLDLSGGDILLHSGDATGRGTVKEMEDFLKWFGEQDYAHRVYIPGNHDWLAERNPELTQELATKNGVILLNDSGITMEGVKIWGSAVQPWYHDWAFNRERGPDIREHWDMIPLDTEILITHGPVYKILDQTVHGEYVGCVDLLDRIKELAHLKMHQCGHIHERRGYEIHDGKLFLNASSLDHHYYMFKVRKPIRITRSDDGIYQVVE